MKSHFLSAFFVEFLYEYENNEILKKIFQKNRQIWGVHVNTMVCIIYM